MATANANGESKTYPVWVGNLHDGVTEGVLKQKFSGFGSIQSCKIMKDEKGKSKNFGFVNFVIKAKAENAAKKMNGCQLSGKVMKTKGPAVLRKEGHLKKAKNYRPLTDCSFFVEGKGCSKGDECPYRHNERARQQTDVCQAWINKSCVKLKCPKRHPRRQDIGSDASSGLSLYSNHSSSKSSLNVPVDFSDSEDSLSLSLYDYDSDLSSSHHSGIVETPPPVRAHGSSNQSPIMAKFRKNYDGQYDSTQSFTVSPDDEDEIDLQDINDENEEFPLYSSDDDNEDDDEWNCDGGGPPSITRLLSLTKPQVAQGEEGDDEYEDNEEGEEPLVNKVRSCPEALMNKNSPRDSFDAHSGPVAAAVVPVPLEPVGLFWDIENCPVPLDKSAFALANKMRREFFKGKREAEFMCVCDITKERKEVTDDLHRAHVTLVHVNAIAKNAADDKLKHSIRRFTQTFPPPATMVLVSGDVNFSFELSDARHVHNMTTILVHNEYTNEALKVCAHHTILFEDFVKDVEPPKFVPPPTAAVLIVGQLPNVDPYKIKNKLSRLADNCGGRVLRVDSVTRTARILFRSMESALKAKKRMTGENVYGVSIRPEIEAQPQPPSQAPPTYPRSNPPYHYSQPPPRPGFQQPRPPPGGHFQPVRGPPPPHPHFPPPPPPPQRYPPRPPPYGFPPPPRVLLPHPSAAGFPNKPSPVFRLFIPDLKVSHEDEFDNITAIFTETRLAVNIKSSLPEFFWESLSSACLLSEFNVVQTAELRRFSPLLQLIHTRSNIPVELVQKFLSQCLHDLSRQCLRMSIPWDISICKWSAEEENDRRVLSNVVSLLKKYNKHWEKWKKFKEKYNQMYDSALSEMMIQQCSRVIQLLGSGNHSDEVILFTEFSPTIKFKKTEEFVKNTVAMLQSLPNNRMRLIEFVEAYQKYFGKITTTGGNKGRDLQDILSSCPEFLIRGFKITALYVELNDKPEPVPVQSKEPLELISAEFVTLLKENPGQQIPLNRLQQMYQTRYHRSFRVSDIIPGDTGMRALVDACHGIKCISVPLGRKSETIVVLSSELQRTSSAKSITAASPIPTQFAVQSNVSEPSSADPVEIFKEDITELLNALPEKKVLVSRIPEEFTRHFKKPYLLNKYGGKKTISLLKSIPDVVMIDEEGGVKIAHLIVPEQPDGGEVLATGSDKEDSFTKEQCRRRVEELLYSLPNHQTTLDRFLCEYETFYKEKMTSYCGHSRLLSLLQEMDSTVVISGSGPQRGVRLHPLRVFACQMKELLSGYPKGMMLSAVVPEYNKKFDTEFRAENYGKFKLLPVVESIPDVVKITGVGAKRIVSLASPSPLPVPVEGARQMFLDEVTSLLLSQQSGETTLEKLSAKYYNTFKRQINFKQLGFTTLQDAVKNLPNVKVSGEGGTAVVQLLTDAVVDVKGPQRRHKRRSSQTEGETSTDIKEDNGASIEKEDLSSSQLITNSSREGSEMINKPLRPRLCETICLRLLSEIHRILLCHPEHSMTLVELCESFKSTEEPSDPKPSDLIEAIDVYSGKKSQHKFLVSRITQEFVLVSLSLPDAMWKLSKDIQYLFVYRPCGYCSMSLDDMLEVYKECYGHRLNPMVYKCKTVEKLMVNKQLKQTMLFDEVTRTISLTLSARLEVFCQLACELLFKVEPECSHITHFVDCFEWYFKTKFSPEQVEAKSLQDLVSRPPVAENIKVDERGKHIVLTSRGLYCEQLRHLMTVNNGRIPLGLLPTMYLSQFHHPEDQEVLRWLQKKPIRYASHIVHLAAEFFIVWAPTGHPYPDTRAEKQSLSVPDDRSVTLSELGSVPEVLASLVNDPLPPESIEIDLDENDEPLKLVPEMPSLVDDTWSSEVRQHRGHFDISDLPGFSSLASIREGNKEEGGQTSSSAIGDTDLITGLDHGEFAGMTHQSVLEQMKNEMRTEEDSRARLDRMGAYLEYFGELSALELERVDGPQVPKPRKAKGKPKLAIQFPGQSSIDDGLLEKNNDKSYSSSSPRTSPILGGDNKGMGPDCLPNINTSRFFNHDINEWESQLGNHPFGVNGDNCRREEGGASSPGSSTEWPSL